MFRIFGTTVAFLGLTSAAVAQSVSPGELQAIAKEAYVYSYAPIASYGTWSKQATLPDAPEYVGGFNVFRHYSEAFTPENKDLVTPNNDTPYSWAWLDLRAEPMVLSVPAVPKDRYYVMQLIDLFTYNFAYVGVRSTGFDAGNYVIAGPSWKGDKPEGIDKVFQAETDIIGILGRTSLDGKEDVPNVKAIQAQYKLEPLSKFLKKPAPQPAPAIEFPPYDVAKTTTHDFIGYINFLLQFAQPPVPAETELMARFAKIGIAPGQAWDPSKVDPATLAAIDQGVADAKAEMAEVAKTTLSSNGLFGTREFLKGDYMKRAMGAEKGLYGNSLEEAWYGGFVGDGSKQTMLHFDADKLPPAKFFWSLTLYTLPDRFLYANPLDRYSIGDRTKGLQYSKDKSLTIYLGHESPGKAKESNWLPTPEGKYSLVARIYGPAKSAMDGTWKLPEQQPMK
ncbi:DUF1254 domain-containing protein [Sinorhizobium medicae]|nr:DUF1254 domain-containing protein [Sinorhizobium medicae]MDX0921176.1 DUF1254 domain-containing protein [Sinorhizobium medicae]MDX0935047.1 DUF1254 domain-containing protein [Sinorhizobium medicae]MDX0941394.1 DUF1254 domain-containing protein [Sinorhizobium medicae]MDX1029242.1 DUF1254 domain-containing protein [Sinorhizobium medicae]